MTFRVLSEHLVVLAVVPPEPSACSKQEQHSLSVLFKEKDHPPDKCDICTFKEVNSISSSGPHVHTCIYAVHGDPTPAGLQSHWVAVTCPVSSVLIQPVPAISHEVGVEAYGHLPVGRLLLPDPIEHCVEPTSTGAWGERSGTLVSLCKWNWTLVISECVCECRH